MPPGRGEAEAGPRHRAERPGSRRTSDPNRPSACYKLEEIDHLPPETIARAGEGDAAALKTYDERRLSRVGRGSPDQQPSMGQEGRASLASRQHIGYSYL